MSQEQVRNVVISPGGSIVYSESGMELLKRISTVVYLYADLGTIIERIELESRGIVGLKNKSLPDIYAERTILYEKYADVRIDILDKMPEQIVEELRIVL